MNNADVDNLLSKLDSSSSDQRHLAIRELKKFDVSLPDLLLAKFRKSNNWKTRCSCVYHSIPYARDNEKAVELGLEALADKSKIVRYRACMLLACSLNTKAISVLKELEANANDGETRANAHAAIDAIENQNSNYFVDRTHSGKVRLKFD